MKNWVIAALALIFVLPGQAAFADDQEAADDQKIYLDEEYEDERDWAFGIGLGLVELGDNFVQGGVVVSDDDVEQYLMANLRIPFGDRHANPGSSRTGFRGYLEPEIGYYDGDVSSDLLLGINIVGGMPFNAVEFFVGGGIGWHFLDSDLTLPSGDDPDDALGVNAHFGVDVSVSESVSFFGMGRFDLIDDDRDELEGKAAVGLRLHF
jgi:hypothetical protein